MIRVRLNYTGPASGFSVFHFDGDVNSGTVAQDAADAVETWIGTFNDQFATSQSMRVDPEVLGIDISTGQTNGVETVTTTAINGAGASSQVAQLANYLVRWRTGSFVNGREIRGRTFLPGCSSSSAAANGEVATAAISAIDAASVTLLANSTLGVYSPANAGFSTANVASTWNEFASMRSRRD